MNGFTAAGIRNKENKRSTADELREAAGLAAGLGAAALIFHALGIGCPIRWLTGIPCAGCGMTRALISFATCHFREAVRFHPLVFAVPPAFLLWVFRRRLPGRAKSMLRKAVWAAAGAFIAVYAARIFAGDPLLHPDIRSGVLWKLAKEAGNVLSVLRQ